MGSPRRERRTWGHIEDAGFRVGPFDTPQSMRERLGAAHDQQYALGQGIREEADAAGAGVAVDDVVQALRRRAGQAELDINDRLAGVPEALQREADEVAIQPGFSSARAARCAGTPLAPSRLPRELALGRLQVAQQRDVAAADEMLRRRRGAEYVEPEVTVEEPEAYSEPSVEVTAPEGPRRRCRARAPTGGAASVRCRACADVAIRGGVSGCDAAAPLAASRGDGAWRLSTQNAARGFRLFGALTCCRQGCLQSRFMPPRNRA